MKELVECIVRALVDENSEVSIREVEGEKTVIIEVMVDENNRGKVIGKQGNIARAIRTILNASAMKRGKKAVLEIL